MTLQATHWWFTWAETHLAPFRPRPTPGALLTRLGRGLALRTVEDGKKHIC